MDSEPPSGSLLLSIFPLFVLTSSGMIFSIVLLILLVVCSALISGSEIAFFSLSPTQVSTLENEDTVTSKRILALKERPQTLLATILITNNLVNISIVIVSDYLIEQWLGQEHLLAVGNWLVENGFAWLGTADSLANLYNLSITVVGVTSLLVLFGEIAPKIYANLNNLQFARTMSGPLALLNSMFGPFSRILVSWSNGIEKKITHSNTYQSNTSKEDLDAAIELTMTSDETSTEEEADILKGIVKFGDVSTKQIMKSRVDVTSIDISQNFKDVMTIVKDCGYSRIPVHNENFDQIEGMLYVKDLVGHTDENPDFNWNELVRKNVLYVPESKRIDDLLREFQLKRTHIAIVVDEYGGSAGIVTLEDIMEEVIGDIKDEFDEEEEVEYIELSDGNYIFEGKSLLNDVCRIIGVDTSYFDGIKGEADSLAGLIIEVKGIIPKVETEFEFRDVVLKIVSVSKKRIEKVNIRLKR